MVTEDTNGVELAASRDGSRLGQSNRSGRPISAYLIASETLNFRTWFSHVRTMQ